MDLLEQKHGVNHPLSGMAVLEKICQYTKADKSDPALNNALLTWVVHDLDCAMRNLGGVIHVSDSCKHSGHGK